VAIGLYIGRRFSKVYRVQLKDKVLEHHYAVCLRCGYLLDGLPAEHCCPECGQAYQLDENERIWRKWLASDRDTGFHEEKTYWSEEAQHSPVCLRCGYDLTGFDVRICPDCAEETSRVPKGLRR